MGRKLAATAATAFMAAAMVTALPATPASAAGDPMCNPGSQKYTWTNTSTGWVITHRKAIEHYTDGAVTRTISAGVVTTITASVTATAGAEISGNVALASMEAKVGLELKAEGSRTSSRSESISHRLTKRGTYILYAGTKKATGYYTQYRCDRGTRWINTGNYGKAISWTVATEGGLRCGTAVPSGSMAAQAKRYC